MRRENRVIKNWHNFALNLHASTQFEGIHEKEKFTQNLELRSAAWL